MSQALLLLFRILISVGVALAILVIYWLMEANAISKKRGVTIRFHNKAEVWYYDKYLKALVPYYSGPAHKHLVELFVNTPDKGEFLKYDEYIFVLTDFCTKSTLYSLTEFNKEYPKVAVLEPTTYNLRVNSLVLAKKPSLKDRYFFAIKNLENLLPVKEVSQ